MHWKAWILFAFLFSVTIIALLFALKESVRLDREYRESIKNYESSNPSKPHIKSCAP